MVIVLAFSYAGLFPIRSAFPASAPGRRPHCASRGLLKLYTHYGPPDCSPTIRGLCHEVSISTVTRANRPPAIESNHQLFEWVLPPLVISPFWAHAEAYATNICKGLNYLPLVFMLIEPAFCEPPVAMKIDHREQRHGATVIDPY